MITTLREIHTARAALRRTKRLLAEVYKPEGVRIWLTSRNANLARHTPLELILDGAGELVVAEAERMAHL
jgi:hypothetical protein